MKKTVLAAVFVLGLSGCSAMLPKPKFENNTDIYTEAKTFKLYNVDTYRCNGYKEDYALLTIGAIAFKEKGKQTKYYLTAFYNARDWMFILNGESFQSFVYDSKLFLNSTSGSLNSRNIDNRMVSEFATWEISRSDLEKIASTQVFQFKILGRNNNIERCMDPEHRKPFKEFLDKTINF